MALTVQYVAAAKANDLISVREVLLTDGAHAVVAVELGHWFSSRRRLWGFCRLRLRIQYYRFPSLRLLLVSASLCGKGLTFVFDTTLQIEEHVHAPLLRVVEPRGDLDATLVWRARQWASGHPPLPLVVPHSVSARGLSCVHRSAVPKQRQLLWTCSVW